MKTLLKVALTGLCFTLTTPAFASEPIVDATAKPSVDVATNPIIDVSTNLGDFKLELYPEKAPKSVENFLKYVNDGSYVGTQFHRVISGFVIQGGGFDTNFKARPSSYGEVVNESKNGLKNNQATIAMARTSNPNSATRQFYINLENNSSLDATEQQAGYTVFGNVIEGFSVIKKIAGVKTVRISALRMQDVPQQSIVIKQIKVQNSTPLPQNKP